VLPITPFTETAGTFVNIEGRAQSFHATVNPLADARPGWKVLRVLGSLLGIRGTEFDTIDEVRKACLGGKDVAKLLSNEIGSVPTASPAVGGIQRIADVPIYFADPLVRRSGPLQKTREARAPRALMNSKLMRELGLTAGQPVKVKQGSGEATLACALDDKLPDGCVRVAAGHASTAALGAMFGGLSVEKAPAEQAA